MFGGTSRCSLQLGAANAADDGPRSAQEESSTVLGNGSIATQSDGNAIRSPTSAFQTSPILTCVGAGTILLTAPRTTSFVAECARRPLTMTPSPGSNRTQGRLFCASKLAW